MWTTADRLADPGRSQPRYGVHEGDQRNDGDDQGEPSAPVDSSAGARSRAVARCEPPVKPIELAKTTFDVATLPPLLA